MCIKITRRFPFRRVYFLHLLQLPGTTPSSFSSSGLAIGLVPDGFFFSFLDYYGPEKPDKVIDKGGQF